MIIEIIIIIKRGKLVFYYWN